MVAGVITRKKRIAIGLALTVISLGTGIFAYFYIARARRLPNVKASPTNIGGKNLPSMEGSSPPDGPDYGEIGFALMENESLGFMRYGLPAAEVTRTLGKPEEKSPAAVWEADGWTHQNWYYRTKGIELNFIGEEQEQTVNMITIKSPCIYRTKRGIGIGNARESVLKAYQEGINPEDSGPDSLVVGTVYGGLIFHLKAGRVSSIFIGAAAE